MKDCPFCGLQPMTSKNTYNSMRSDDFSVYCGECDIGFTEDTLEEAQRKWGARPMGAEEDCCSHGVLKTELCQGCCDDSLQQTAMYNQWICPVKK